jgi:hypothetical protein
MGDSDAGGGDLDKYGYGGGDSYVGNFCGGVYM